MTENHIFVWPLSALKPSAQKTYCLEYTVLGVANINITKVSFGKNPCSNEFVCKVTVCHLTAARDHGVQNFTLSRLYQIFVRFFRNLLNQSPLNLDMGVL